MLVVALKLRVWQCPKADCELLTRAPAKLHADGDACGDFSALGLQSLHERRNGRSFRVDVKLGNINLDDVVSFVLLQDVAPMLEEGIPLLAHPPGLTDEGSL